MQRFLRIAICAAATVLVTSPVWGMEHAADITVHKTRHFLLHTDLPPAEVQSTLAEMESALQFAAAYWGRPPRGRIECYIAQDVAAWPESALPHPLARVWIGGVGGATVCDPPTGGRKWGGHVTMYASTLPGVARHEVVHAYCCQNFRATGPDWYKEGMAEVASCGVGRDVGIACSSQMLDTIKNTPARSVASIVTSGPFTRGTARSLGVMLANRLDASRPVLLDEWTDTASAELAKMQADYHWSWALCYFLTHNRNYATSMRHLGRQYLEKDRGNFREHFGRVARRMEFEFAQFLAHVQPGFRADLCTWDWETRWTPLAAGSHSTRRIHARRGYQATGVEIEAGRTYTFSATGTWSIGKAECDADGLDGMGLLQAAVLDGLKLSAPFPLGSAGDFIASGSGNLYVRCSEAWHQLADNSGSVTLRIER